MSGPLLFRPYTEDQGRPGSGHAIGGQAMWNAEQAVLETVFLERTKPELFNAFKSRPIIPKQGKAIKF